MSSSRWEPHYAKTITILVPASDLGDDGDALDEMDDELLGAIADVITGHGARVQVRALQAQRLPRGIIPWGFD